jgi:hypothetical protein
VRRLLICDRCHLTENGIVLLFVRSCGLEIGRSDHCTAQFTSVNCGACLRLPGPYAQSCMKSCIWPKLAGRPLWDVGFLSVSSRRCRCPLGLMPFLLVTGPMRDIRFCNPPSHMVGVRGQHRRPLQVRGTERCFDGSVRTNTL